MTPIVPNHLVRYFDSPQKFQAHIQCVKNIKPGDLVNFIYLNSAQSYIDVEIVIVNCKITMSNWGVPQIICGNRKITDPDQLFFWRDQNIHQIYDKMLVHDDVSNFKEFRALNLSSHLITKIIKKQSK